ncbi:DUF4249 domain-containing protein [Bacteroidota bacterium]
MRVIRSLYMIILFFYLFGCVDPYTPEIDEYQRLMVINGYISNQEGYHYVEVSRSTPFNEPEFIPEEDCDVMVIDNIGNMFIYDEVSPGKYSHYFEEEYLTIGKKFKLEVTTKKGKKYESDYDELLPCPVIDKIYYEIEEKPLDDPLLKSIFGIQFFIDTDASGDFAKNYRWELTETWEYHSKYFIGDYFADSGIIYSPELTDSLYYCWRTEKIREVYTITTKQAISDKIIKTPLNFVSNQTDRLEVKYSLLVKQFSLSDRAYEYWNELKVLSKDAGGLYETQPSRIQGNIKCIDKPDELVLGFFNASSLETKRIFVDEYFDFFPFKIQCSPYGYDEETLLYELNLIPPSRYPIYLLNLSRDSEGPRDYVDQSCFDCRLLKGKTTKPDFWE